MRRIGLRDNPQMTLGELIRAIEAMPTTVGRADGDDGPKRVYFDFGRAFPDHLTSYRGSYAELAITYIDGTRRNEDPPTAEAFLGQLRDAVTPGRTFGGWKGGDYQMSTDTPVWVAQWGDWGSTAVVGVRDLGAEIVLDTEWTEF